MKLSLVIPAFNEEKRLGPFLDSVTAYARSHPDHLDEVLVVDDGSTDQTVHIVSEQSRQFPPLRLVAHEQNQGKGAAVRTGVMAASGSHVVFMDADGATAIDELPKMIHALEGADIGIGNRWMRSSKTRRHSLLRQFSGWVNRTYMSLFGLGAIDTMCGFKGYRTDVARDLFEDLIEKRWLFDTEIAYRALRRRYTIKNFPITWTSMDGSKLDGLTLVKSGLKIWPLIQKIRKQEASHNKQHA